MKTRIGFVSNSSSSSFIIHRSVIGEEWHNVIRKLYDIVQQEMIDNEYKDEFDVSWGESGENYDVQNDYLFVETYNAPEEVRKIIREYKDKAYNYYG